MVFCECVCGARFYASADAYASKLAPCPACREPVPMTGKLRDQEPESPPIERGSL